jgi:hypothetical protein
LGCGRVRVRVRVRASSTVKVRPYVLIEVRKRVWGHSEWVKPIRMLL